MSLFTTAIFAIVRWSFLVLYESKYEDLNEQPHAHFLFQNHMQETRSMMSSELFVESSGVYRCEMTDHSITLCSARGSSDSYAAPNCALYAKF